MEKYVNTLEQMLRTMEQRIISTIVEQPKLAMPLLRGNATNNATVERANIVGDAPMEGAKAMSNVKTKKATTVSNAPMEGASTMSNDTTEKANLASNTLVEGANPTNNAKAEKGNSTFCPTTWSVKATTENIITTSNASMWGSRSANGMGVGRSEMADPINTIIDLTSDDERD